MWVPIWLERRIRVDRPVVFWNVISGLMETSSIPKAFIAASPIDSLTIPTRIVSVRSTMVVEAALPFRAFTMALAVIRNKKRTMCRSIVTHSFGRNQDLLASTQRRAVAGLRWGRRGV